MQSLGLRTKSQKYEQQLNKLFQHGNFHKKTSKNCDIISWLSDLKLYLSK